jgi:glycosyltransferase involved in cell wall biosynthesis
MENQDICVIMLSIGNQYKYLDYTISSFEYGDIQVKNFYVLHYDSYYQYKTMHQNIINIDLEQYEYNICKCFNSLKHNSNKWIIWDSTYFFNQSYTDSFKKIIKETYDIYDVTFVYGVNLCLDIYNYRDNNKYCCKTGGCFVIASTVELDENCYNFVIKKSTCKKIKYELDDNHNYYFFNFAEAVHEDLMLIKYFRDEYMRHMYSNKFFLSFSHFYYNKTKTHIDSGSAYLLNNHLKAVKLHQFHLPGNIENIYFYRFQNGCRSKIFSGTQYNDYSITIITLVRNNKHFLKESMGSLINQTSSNWNCIIINDGSEDIIKYEDFLTKENILHERHFKIINLSEWNGLVKCHKLAMLHATNEIVGVLDADDMLDNQAIEKVLNIYNGTKKDNIFVYTNFFICDENMKKVSLGYGSEIKTCLLSDRCGNHFRTFKTKYYYLTSGFDDDLQFGGEDQDILFKMEVVSQPIFLNEPLYLYRVPTNNSSTITSLKTITIYSLFVSIFKNIYDRYKNLNFVLKFYTSKSKIKSFYKNIKNISKLNGVEYYAEVTSNNIFIMDGSAVNGVDKYLNEFIVTHKAKFDVGLKWNYYEKKFEYVEKYNLDIKEFSKIHPSTYFNHIYILNLAQDVVKKERMERLFKNLGVKVEFIEAVYGKSEPYLSEYKSKYTSGLKSPGAYGYSLTMIKIFTDAIKNRYKKILVCDDDIIFHKDFLNKFDEGIRKIPFDWKVLFFGLSGPWSGVNVNNDIKAFNFNKSFLKNVANCDGSYCVGYDLNILQTLIDITSNFDAPFDTAIIKYFNNENIPNIYAFYPYLVLADTTTSQIQFRESDTLDNFNANQFKFRQNMDNYDLHSMLNKNYEKFYNNPYPKVSLIAIIEKEDLRISLMLNSFVDQTYDNTELIIVISSQVNDICYAYLNDFLIHDNITIIKDVKNNCKKIGLENATGSIIGFISCENYMLSNYISKQIKKMNELDSLIVGSNVIYTHLDSLHIVKDDNQNLNRANQLIENTENGFGVQFGISTLLFKKYLIDIEQCEDISTIIESILMKKFNTYGDMLSFLHNESNVVYSKVDEILVISQGNSNIQIIKTIKNQHEVHPTIKSIPQKSIPQKSIKNFDDNLSICSNSFKKHSNYDIIMKLKSQHK